LNQLPYNPLEKTNLARSVEDALLSATVRKLSDTSGIVGAGIYAIYYVGDFVPYAPLLVAHNAILYSLPIYVGKAIPKGGRKGGMLTAAGKGHALSDRLRQHYVSISETSNLNPDSFFFRHLTVDDIWIPLGENVLVDKFRPLWNIALDGFGNKDPGQRRKLQYKSPWDIMHPGRSFAKKLADSGVTANFLADRTTDHFARKPLAKLPKVLASQASIEE
jgi:hypothetical protein